MVSGTCTSILGMLQNGSQGGGSLVADVGPPEPPVLNQADYPLVTYWLEDEWAKQRSKGITPVHGQSTHSTAAKCAYIQKSDGTSLDEVEWKRLNSVTRALFNGLDPVPESWLAHSSLTQRVTVYHTLIFSFPCLGLGNGYWKAEKYCVNQYPLWKSARHKENLKNQEENMRKRKAQEHDVASSIGTAPVTMSANSSKRVKVARMNLINPL